MKKLTKPQLDALTLLSLAGKEGSTPYNLQQSCSTLRALVKRDLAQRKPGLGDHFLPRQQRFVITEAGHKALYKEIHE